MSVLFMVVGCKGQDDPSAPAGQRRAEGTLKEVFGERFLVGTSMNDRQIVGLDERGDSLIARHFNAVVAENVMKHEVVHPSPEKYDFLMGDVLARFASLHDMKLIGHCLVWHSQCAPWFCVGDDGKPVDAETLKARLKEHITAVVGHYKGKVWGWDVVNEAIMEDGSYRKTPFYEILGEEFIPLAFEYAHEADPEAELYINDYNMHHAGKREAYVRLVNDLRSRGLRVDAIGMQCHWGLDYPTLQEVELAIEAYASTGAKVMVTEWDMTALPTVHESANVSESFASLDERLARHRNPYPEGLPDSVAALWNQRMAMFMDLFLRHSDEVSRVCVWGASDGDSWKNDFPIFGRKDYPLLFDRDYKAKPFLEKYGVK